MIKLFLISFFSFFLSQGLFGQSIKELNSRLREWTPVRRDIYEKIVRYYSPVIHHDAEFQEIEVDGAIQRIHNPYDLIVSPFYDGDSNLQNNPENLAVVEVNGVRKRKFPLIPRIPALVKETESHIYIEIFVYHPLDRKKGSAHLNDSEKIWMVLKILDPDFDSNSPETLERLFNPELQDEPPFELEFVVLDSHGDPKFYSPNASTQKRLRKNYKDYLNSLEPLQRLKLQIRAAGATMVFDRNAIEHHDTSAPVFLKGLWGEPANMLVFQCAVGHALYMCNPKAWKKGKGWGYVYVCDVEGNETPLSCENFIKGRQATARYSILMFDDVIFEIYYPELLSSEMRERIRQARNFKYQRDLIFDSQRRQQDLRLVYETSLGKIRPAPNLPRALVKGPDEAEPKATLPNDWGMKDRRSTALPHHVHITLDPQNRDRISDVYIFNPWAEYI